MDFYVIQPNILFFLIFHDWYTFTMSSLTHSICIYTIYALNVFYWVEWPITQQEDIGWEILWDNTLVHYKVLLFI